MIWDNKIIIEDMEHIYSRNIPWNKLFGKTILITGAYGMLASYVTAVLIYLNEYKSAGLHIIAVVRSYERFCEKFGKYADRDYVETVISEVDRPIRYDGKIDYIIHAASHASGNYFKMVPVDVIKPNVLGTYYLLELARANNVDGFMLFSSGDIYGKTVGVENITENDFGILDTLDGHSCYGESKRLAETMCKAYHDQYGVPMTILRIFPTYAPTMDLENDPRAIATFVKDVLSGKDIVLKSDGKKAMSFCYIADAVAGYFTVLLKGKPGEAYNICNSEELCTVRELAETLCSLGGDLNVIMLPRSKEEQYLENNYQSWLRPSNKKLCNLGWYAEYSIREGFSRVIGYFLDEKEQRRRV